MKIKTYRRTLPCKKNMNEIDAVSNVNDENEDIQTHSTMQENMNEIDDNFKHVMDETEPEDAVYGLLKVDDEDNDPPSTFSSTFDDEDNKGDGDDGLLEPFPESVINHVRRPREADIDADVDDKNLRP